MHASEKTMEIDPKRFQTVPTDYLNQSQNQCRFEKTQCSYYNLPFSLFRHLIVLLFDYKLVLLTIVIVIPVIYLLYKCYVSPDLVVKQISEIGFNHIGGTGASREGRIAHAQSTRKLGCKVPPPYPNGWFAVAESRDLRNGGVLPANVLGQNLCVYRGEDGTARCVDAYCPHLGANMAVGGTVRGSCIECPFHHWRFNCRGELASVPGVDNLPKGISVKSWHTTEADGAVWIWHDADGREPMWNISDPEEMKTFSYRGRNEFHVSCHIQEIPENGADVAHLNAVHATSMLSTLGETYPALLNLIGAHHWSADWSRNDDHTATIRLQHDYKIMKMNIFHMDIHITQIGPGHVRLRMSTPFGPLLVSQSVTPTGPARQLVVHRMFTPTYNALIGLLMNRGESRMLERDVAIWNSKRYIASPAYVKTDKNIKAFRAWFSQFYSENSVSFRDAHQNTLEW